MKTIDLAAGLGISTQMTNRLIKQGMPRDLDQAIAWRKSHLQPFRTKFSRIGGNSGEAFAPTKLKIQPHEVERIVNERTLTNIIPNRYFERVDWLAIALKEAGVPVTGKQVIEIQDSLFSVFMEEIIYGYFEIDSVFELPPLFEMRIDSKERKSRIAALDKLLSEDHAPE